MRRMNYTARGDSITRKDVEAALVVSQTIAGRLLKGLAGRGEIRVVGNGKNTRYVK